MTPVALPEEFLNRFAPDAVIGVAVSGGGDSMALLHLLSESSVPLRVATVNHNLRAEAADEAKGVGAFCESRGIPHEVLHWDWDGRGNLQDQARKGRYSLLSEWALRVGVSGVALGHTADDNIETFLMGLSRGAGLDGLSGMRPEFAFNSVKFYRPLLSAYRSDLREVLREEDIHWFDDPSNDDPNYHRIQVRQNINALNALGVSPEQLLNSINNLHATRRDVNADIARGLDGHFTLDRGDLCFDRQWIESLSSESQRRVLNSALQFVSGQEYPPRGTKLMRVLADLRQKNMLHGCVMEMRDHELRVGREFGAVSELCVHSKQVWDKRWSIDGPHSISTEIRALGEVGLAQCAATWRETGLPRSSLMASPSVWDGDQLLAAPLAGLDNNWVITLRQDSNEYIEFVLSH